MSDIFDHEGFGSSGPLGSPEGGPYRSRKELEAENERLRRDLSRSQEENEMLAELLTGQFEDGSGEIDGGVGEGARSEERSRFAISDAAIDLFEALPPSFTLDEALDQADQLGQTSTEAARHLRVYLTEQMVVQAEERFVKTGSKPYF
jgi:hypothetical protein